MHSSECHSQNFQVICFLSTFLRLDDFLPKRAFCWISRHILEGFREGSSTDYFYCLWASLDQSREISKRRPRLVIPGKHPTLKRVFFKLKKRDTGRFLKTHLLVVFERENSLRYRVKKKKASRDFNFASPWFRDFRLGPRKFDRGFRKIVDRFFGTLNEVPDHVPTKSGFWFENPAPGSL